MAWPNDGSGVPLNIADVSFDILRVYICTSSRGCPCHITLDASPRGIAVQYLGLWTGLMYVSDSKKSSAGRFCEGRVDAMH